MFILSPVAASCHWFCLCVLSVYHPTNHITTETEKPEQSSLNYFPIAPRLPSQNKPNCLGNGGRGAAFW